MRTNYHIHFYKRQIYRFRVAQGRYLKDIPFESLRSEERERILDDARTLLLKTKLQLKLIRLPHNRRKKAWRFVERSDQ